MAVDFNKLGLSPRAYAFTIASLLELDPSSTPEVERANCITDVGTSPVAEDKEILTGSFIAAITRRHLHSFHHPKEVNPSEDKYSSKKSLRDCCESSLVGVAPSKVECHLETHDLWNRFRRLGLTEMIITKAGRRMFPSLRVSFSGLRSNAVYDVVLDILPVDGKRYRYAYHRSTWLTASDSSRSDDILQVNMRPEVNKCSLREWASYRHPDSPFTGYQLEGRTVSFDKVKLTNCADRYDKNDGYIVLTSMRKYRPHVRLVLRTDCIAVDGVIKRNHMEIRSVLPSHQTANTTEVDCVDRFQLSGCEFIAVTAYQNQLITKLKIENNPFAKGFRDFYRFNRFNGDRIFTARNHVCRKRPFSL